MLNILSVVGLLMASPGGLEAPATEAKAEPEKRICRKEVDTGSLVRARKICRTRQEWIKADSNGRSTAASMQDRSLIRPTNGIPGE